MYQCGMLNSVCCKVMTWTSSCLSTRAQLKAWPVVFGLASATTLPVQAPTVGMNGRPIVRPLNHWWFFMISILVLPGGA